MLSHLADLEKSGYKTNTEGHISADCLRHIILDLGIVQFLFTFFLMFSHIYIFMCGLLGLFR